MRAQQVIVAVGTTSTLLLPANPRRVCLTLSGDGTNTFTVSLRNPAVALQGIVLTPTNPRFRLTRADLGDNIGEQWFVVASAAGATITVFESFE